MTRNIKTCFRICFEMKMDEEDEMKQGTYVVGDLGDDHLRMKGFKMSVDVAT